VAPSLIPARPAIGSRTASACRPAGPVAPSGDLHSGWGPERPTEARRELVGPRDARGLRAPSTNTTHATSYVPRSVTSLARVGVGIVCPAPSLAQHLTSVIGRQITFDDYLSCVRVSIERNSAPRLGLLECGPSSPHLSSFEALQRVHGIGFLTR